MAVLGRKILRHGEGDTSTKFMIRVLYTSEFSHGLEKHSRNFTQWVFRWP